MAQTLYGATLFTRANQEAVIRGKNNAPGGADGVDADVQVRLGAPGLEDIGLSAKDRKHGICCGITLSWLIGFCHSVQGAQSCAHFPDYFRDNLRFQGAYFKDNKGNVHSIDDLANAGFAHGCVKICKSSSVSMNTFKLSNLGGGLPDKFAMYLGIWHHAIGAAVTKGRYYIMDPNAGLFAYFDQKDWEADLNDLVEARRKSKGKTQGDKFSVYPYTKAQG